MKMLHIQYVPKCKSEGECKFYSRKCWFVHQEDIENAYLNAKNGSQNQNIIHDMEWKIKINEIPTKIKHQIAPMAFCL